MYTYCRGMITRTKQKNAPVLFASAPGSHPPKPGPGRRTSVFRSQVRAGLCVQLRFSTGHVAGSIGHPGMNLLGPSTNKDGHVV